MVEIYLLPLASLLLNFLAMLACLRFLFSRQGLYWIIPLLLTGFLIWPNSLALYGVATDSTTIALPYTYFDLQPLLLSLLWYALIPTFHYALKKTIRVNNYEEQVRKNLHEARYLAAKSPAAMAQTLGLPIASRSGSIRLNAYSTEWIQLFDEQ